MYREFTPVDTEAIIQKVPSEIQSKPGALTPADPQQLWPNLIPYTPPGPPPWPGPTMLQNYDTMYVYHTTELFIGEPFLFHMSAANVGDTDSWTGSLVIGIDTGNSLYTVVAEHGGFVLPPWTYWPNKDTTCSCSNARMPKNVAPGNYPIIYVVDARQQVAEGPSPDAEEDNFWFGQVHLVEPTVEYDGYLRYVDQPSHDTLPVRSAPIALWDRWNPENGPGHDSLLDSTTTDDSGHFHFGPVRNRDRPAEPQTPETCLFRLDPYFRYSAENPAATVVPEFDSLPYHSDTTRFVNQQRNGQFDTVIVIAGDSAAPYAVADVMLKARKKWKELIFSEGPQVEVRLAAKQTVSCYDPGAKHIHIENSNVSDSGWPDAFDEYVVCHEYTHFLEDHYRFCNMGGGRHSCDEETTPQVASSEGFAEWFPCYLYSSTRFYDYYSGFGKFDWIDLENGHFGTQAGTDPVGTINNFGKSYEVAVAGAFWDISDAVDDDYTTYYTTYAALWDHARNPQPDGIGDNLDGQTNAMLLSLTDRFISGLDRPTRITEMWQTWLQNPSWGNEQKLADVMTEHGIGGFGTTGDLTCNGCIDLSDLSLLIVFITLTPRPVLHCPAEANVDARGIIDLSDLSLLIAYLTTTPPPVLPEVPDIT